MRLSFLLPALAALLFLATAGCHNTSTQIRKCIASVHDMFLDGT